MINLIICGAPGCGKGTQSDLIVRKYNLTHISTGDLLRKEIADNTELGKVAYQYISKGQLVPDQMIIDILANKLNSLQNSNTNGIILDGFPRTLAQAEALEKLFSERDTQTDILLDLQVDEDELIARLLKRGETSGRSDDNLETIKKRLDVYYNQTKPVSDYYQSLGKYAGIYGMGTIDEIFGRISETIDAKL
ncbi:MAG TPA: adenylate kinase [Paludibacteraceae bacterium]|nr:adenylate kinase [Paludibacteraceae bacterium]HPT42900.1 adenylate kinase [Paludibacteraceae bacterium]